MKGNTGTRTLKRQRKPFLMVVMSLAALFIISQVMMHNQVGDVLASPSAAPKEHSKEHSKERVIPLSSSLYRRGEHGTLSQHSLSHHSFASRAHRPDPNSPQECPEYFHRSVSATKESYSCHRLLEEERQQLKVMFIWTTGPESFTIRNQWAIESLLKQHPCASVESTPTASLWTFSIRFSSSVSM